MMQSVFTQTPLNMTKTFPQDGNVLDLRVPKKQNNTNCVGYTLMYPSPKSSPNYEMSQENVQNNNPIIYTQSFHSPKIAESIHNHSSPITVLPGYESPNSTVSSSDSAQNSSVSSRNISQPNRPFKSLTKDPFLGIKTAVNLLHEDVDYATFRDKMLAQSRVDYNSTNMNMRRKTVHNENNTDPIYWEKRKKNNEAAKKSRDARKAREDEIAIRCAFLEQENLKLKLKIAAVQSDTERMQNLIYRL